MVFTSHDRLKLIRNCLEGYSRALLLDTLRTYPVLLDYQEFRNRWRHYQRAWVGPANRRMRKAGMNAFVVARFGEKLMPKYIVMPHELCIDRQEAQ